MNMEQFPQSKKTPDTKNKLSPEQGGAIKIAAEIGVQIQKDFPNIALEFINGATLVELANKYNIQTKFSINTEKVAQAAISNALRGYRGKFFPEYLGLIKDTRIYDFVISLHREDSAREIGRKTGGITGMRLMREKRGIHAQTPKEKKESGKASAQSRGSRVFSQPEEDFLSNLDLAEHRTREGKIDAVEITRKLNQKLYPGKESSILPAAVSLFLRKKIAKEK